MSCTHRVLAPTGVLLSISFLQPHFRRPLLLPHEFTWGMHHTLHSLDGGLHYSFDALKKGCRQPQDLPVQLPAYCPDKHATEAGTTHQYMDDEDFLSFMEV